MKLICKFIFQDNDGRTAFRVCSEENDKLSEAKILLEHGADAVTDSKDECKFKVETQLL